MYNNLVLRIINSPYGDMTRGAVLAHEDVDNNFIYLKGKLINSGITQNNNLLLQSLNGEVITIPFNFTGSSSGLNIIAKTTSYNILNSDNDIYFTNEGATNSITLTLPIAIKNLRFTFIADNDNEIIIQTSGSNIISIGIDVTNSGGYISSINSGNIITLVAINSNKWIATSVIGSWII